MRRGLWSCVGLGTALLVAGAVGPVAAAEMKLLWQIGQPDNHTAELAMGPKDYAQFSEDPLFVVGASDAKRDWPYVHPGPADTWAGGRQHDFTIVFALKQPPAGGNCRLLFDLADTHDRSPSTLRIGINGRELLKHVTPRGGPDDSIMGDPAQGREHRFTVDVPAAAMGLGTNEIVIGNVAGSWVLYDWLGFEAPDGVELAPVGEATLVSAIRSQPVLVEKDGRLRQTIEATIRHIGPPAEAAIALAGAEAVKVSLKPGSQTVRLTVPAVESETPVTVEVKVAGKEIARREVVLKPVRKWTVYLLPHSHVDIGYTQLQTQVEQDHWRFFQQAIEASRRTAGYPDGAQFKWNAEVLWAVDSYLKQATAEKQQEFIEAVKKGWIGLDALYGNELTALCRPEELVRLVDYAQRISRRCGVNVDSAMITDVPGYTWGLTSVLADGGVKYLSCGPNSSARIGHVYHWGDKPFYWITPCGRHKVLCWIPRTGYFRAFSNLDQLLGQLQRLEAADYPYDMMQIRYCLGDNAGPAVQLCEMIKDFNTKHAYPKLVIATTSQMFHDFEQRYGDKIPEAGGDFTPYWEDGAASSARETGINRASAERLARAEAIFAMISPKDYPADDFYAAWRNVVLYDEHTWGAHNSISQPDSEFARGQWAIKQAFALDGEKQSRALLAAATTPLAKRAGQVGSVLVFNTASWPRTDLVVLPKDLALAGDLVKDPDGTPVPSQRLSAGALAFVAREVPPLGAKRFSIQPGTAAGGDAGGGGRAKAGGNKVSHESLCATLDKKTGAIAGLRHKGIDAELVDGKSGLGLNDYFYVAGTDPKSAERNGPVKITVKETGPLVASLLVESDAPGCRKLSREVRLIDGIDRLDIINVVDKEKIRTKEGVRFAFAFHVPDGVMRMDIPWAVARPEVDQLPGSCKNWFTVQRFVDVSGEKHGVTWATVDAPLVEVGAITAETPWIEKLEPTRTLYSYVMNNYWFTNYKADQEGPTVFRYSLRPHTGGYRAIEATRFGIEQSQPLVAVPARTRADGPAILLIDPRLKVEPAEVIVATFKPSNDRKAWIVRLFGVGGRAAKATLTWSDPAPKTVWLSNVAEEPKTKVTGPIEVPAMGMVTLRAELPD